MDSIAKLQATERADLFREVANRRGMAPLIIEKDFWVCWTLKHIFGLTEISSHLIFKGGTSLSKVYGIIERFSEDIDLSINRDYLGFGGEQDPERAGGSSRTRRQLEALQQACCDNITDELLPALRHSFTQVLDSSGNDPEQIAWQLIQDTDPQNLLFTYPGEKSFSNTKYIRPIVKIELGARSDHWPANYQSIKPYAAEEFPTLFEQPSCTVKVLEAERTFWEKATILHAEYYRPEDSATADRISRHYYDLHQLATSPIAEKALNRLDLLDRVVRHKSIFFRLGRANYEESRRGNIHLLPSETRLAALRADYSKMRDMFFGEQPTFEEVLETLKSLEATINTKTSAREAFLQ